VQTKQAADVLVEGFEEMQYAVFTGKTKSYQLISKGEINDTVYYASLGTSRVCFLRRRIIQPCLDFLLPLQCIERQLTAIGTGLSLRQG
jgi:hypothetical protein